MRISQVLVLINNSSPILTALLCSSSLLDSFPLSLSHISSWAISTWDAVYTPHQTSPCLGWHPLGVQVFALVWPHHSPNVNILQIPQILNCSKIPRIYGRQTVSYIWVFNCITVWKIHIRSFSPSCASNVDGIDGVGPMLKCTNNSPLVISWMVRGTIQTSVCMGILNTAVEMNPS